MKIFKKIVLFVLTAMMTAFCFSGCGEAVTAKGEAELFSTYMTFVVRKEEPVSEENKLPARFNYVCGRGEVETAQLVLYAKSHISTYTIELSDLINENGDVFSAKNFEAFNQKYINVITPTKGEAGEFGYFPDAILPFEKAVEYKENFVKKDNNQAILVQATVPTEQASGNYSGKFKLTIDGKEINVPVSMKIYDVVIPTTTGLESLYIYSRYELTGGEADDSLEMMKKYYDKLLEYKCMGYFLPVSQQDPVGYAQAVREYYDKISNYAIPYSYVISGSNYLLSVEGTWNYIIEILKLSAEDGKEYLSKAANYYGVIDEPISNGTIDKCNTFCDSYNKGVIELAEKARQFAKDGDYTEAQLAILEKEAQNVEKMPNYITAHYDELISDHVVNYCPGFDRFDDEVQREEYASVEGKDWYYGCTSPRNPYATFHIDDRNHLESTQLLGWTSNEYDVSGTLYWETVLYRGYTPNVGYDCYEQANRNNPITSNGEGYLLYPGAPYGIEGPVASLRLISARDGCDDYDLLNVLEDLYSQNGYDAQTALEIIYRSLYNGTKCMNNNHATLAAARESVFNLILMAQEGVFVTSSDYTLNGWSVSGVSPEGKEVKINGKTISENGKFKFDISLVANKNEYVLSCGEYSVDYSVSGIKSQVFGNEDALIRVNPSSDFTSEVVNGDKIGYSGNVTEITFNAEAESKTFILVGNDFEKIYNKKTQDAIFTIYNPTDERMVCNIKSQGVSYEFSVTNVFLKPGMNEIHLGNLSVLNWTQNKELTYLSFTIDGSAQSVYFCDAYVVNLK